MSIVPNTDSSAPPAVPSLMVPPLMVAPPVSVRKVPSSIWTVAPLAVSVKVVPLTVSPSSVSVTPLATVTPPSFRLALLIVLEPVTSMLPNTAELVLDCRAVIDGAAIDSRTRQRQRCTVVDVDHTAGISDINLNIKRATGDLDRSRIRNAR